MSERYRGLSKKFEKAVPINLYATDFTDHGWKQIVLAWCDTYGIDVPDDIDAIEFWITTVNPYQS